MILIVVGIIIVAGVADWCGWLVFAAKLQQKSQAGAPSPVAPDAGFRIEDDYPPKPERG